MKKADYEFLSSIIKRIGKENFETIIDIAGNCCNEEKFLQCSNENCGSCYYNTIKSIEKDIRE